MTTIARKPVTRSLGARALLALASAGLALMLGGCSYHPPVSLSPEGVAQILNSTPYGRPTQSDRWQTFDDPGRFSTYHGFTCTRASRAATATSLGIRVEDQIAIPADADATVFLNGWDAKYTSNDHHVTGLGAVIFNVLRVGNTLTWDAGGLIADKNGDDAFEWCYRYTVLVWSRVATSTALPRRIDVGALVSQKGQRLIAVDETAFSSRPVLGVPSSFDTPAQPPRAKLFMGFALSYSSADHHVMKAGLDLGRTTLAGQNVSFVSKALLQDKNRDDSTDAAVVSTILTGGSVREWQPATVQRLGGSEGVGPAANAVDLSPASGSSFCSALGGMDERVEEYSIPNVPFRYAVPMLTGWSTGYSCTDHHVKRVGAYIDTFRYDRPAGALTGTLYYTVRTVMQDNARHDASWSSVAVTVLGIDPVLSLATTGQISGTLVSASGL